MSSENTDGSGNRLVTVLTQQREVYQLLGELAEQQGALIAANDADGLLKLLSARQQLVDCLGLLNEELIPMRQRWDEVLADMSDGDRQQVKSLVLEVNELLQSILKRDARDSEELSTRKGDVESELSRAATGRKAHVAYAATSSGEARFVDQTDEES